MNFPACQSQRIAALYLQGNGNKGTEPMHTLCIAKHKTSGVEKTFQNVRDREEYITAEIREYWVFFFRAPNGFEYGHK